MCLCYAYRVLSVIFGIVDVVAASLIPLKSLPHALCTDLACFVAGAQDINGMTADQLKEFLHARNPGRWSKKRLASMSTKQLRGFARTRRNGGFTIKDVFTMTPTQMRRALARVCPGLWTEDELKAMGEYALREALLHRLQPGVRYYGESDLAGLSTQQLRVALILQQPGVYEDVDTMKTRALRAALRRGRRFAYTDVDLVGLSLAQLRAVLRAQDPARWTAQKVARMSESDIRAILHAQHRSGFTVADLPFMSASQLREVMQTVCPGLFGAEELQAKDDDQLRQELWIRMSAGRTYLRESDIASMHSDELRVALLRQEPRYDRTELAEMDAVTLRKHLQTTRRLGYRAKVLFCLHKPFCSILPIFRTITSKLSPSGHRKHDFRSAAHRAKRAQPHTMDQRQARDYEREGPPHGHEGPARTRVPESGYRRHECAAAAQCICKRMSGSAQ